MPNSTEFQNYLHLLATMLGAFLVGDGVLTQAQWSQALSSVTTICGAAMTLITLALSIYNHHNQILVSEKQASTQVTSQRSFTPR